MAGTRWVVNWALNYTCPIQSNLIELKIRKKVETLTLASRMGEHSYKKNKLYELGDYYIESLHNSREYKRGSIFWFPRVPKEVKSISKTLGGLDTASAKKWCESCVANVDGSAIAGCWGRFYIEQANRQDFWREYERFQLENPDALNESFADISLEWHRLWCEPVLGQKQINVLIQIFEAAFMRKSVSKECGVPLFISALKLAKRDGLEINVELNLPGHSDMGVDTIHPHCPYCKFPHSMWMKPPEEITVCLYCGTEYIPMETYSYECWEDREKHELLKWFGYAGLRKFTFDYLRQCGVGRYRAGRVWQKYVKSAEKDCVEGIKENFLVARQHKFYNEVILCGEEGDGASKDLFNTTQTQNILAAAKKWGAPVWSMSSWDIKEQWDRDSKESPLEYIKRIDPPLDCRFSIHIHSIPAESVDRWFQELPREEAIKFWRP